MRVGSGSGWRPSGGLARRHSGWIEALAADAATDPRRRKSCILLWMTGGPSQIDTFDPKPGHANGGPFKPIETAVPGMLLGEHLPKLARQAKDLAVDPLDEHQGRGPRPGDLLPPDRLPAARAGAATRRSGSLVANELDDDSAELPGFVSIAPFRFVQPGGVRPGISRARSMRP